MVENISDWISDRIPLVIWDKTLGPIYNWSNRRQLRKEIIQKFGRIPQEGDMVCDCRYNHQPIVTKVDENDIILADGLGCSLIHCCDPINHNWNHPE